jgi:hypothetical protein
MVRLLPGFALSIAWADAQNTNAWLYKGNATHSRQGYLHI